MDGPKAFHQKILVIDDLIAAVFNDNRCIAAGGHHRNLPARKFLPDPIHDAIDHAGGTVNDTGAAD